MFGDLKQVEKMKEKLDSVSSCFCMAKWLHASIHLTTGQTHSCYLPLPHQIPLTEIAKNPSALHNTAYKKLQRKKMLEGNRPEECGACWAIEDLPGERMSDRHFRAVDSWTMPFFERVRELPWDADVNPTYLEVSFSSLCNFKCSYCIPQVSSTWQAEIEKSGYYALSRHEIGVVEPGMLPIPDDQPNPYIDAFWKWWPTLVKDLLFFRVTGGEPLLSRHTYALLEWFERNPQSHLELSVSSNLGIPENYFERFLSTMSRLLAKGAVKSFILHTSIDAVGAKSEYIRNGLVFERFERNLERVLNELPGVRVGLMCTFNNLSVVGFRPFLEWVQDLRTRYPGLLLDIPHLRTPIHQQARILTAPYLKMMEEHILFMKARGFNQSEIEQMRRILEWMRQPMDPALLDEARADFYLFFREHDRRRGTDIHEAFPEMRDFWGECKSAMMALGLES